MKPGQSSTLRLKLALLACSLLLSLFLAEIALRVIGYAPNELHLFRPDPSGSGSYRLKPDLNVVTTVAGTEVTIRTNSHGMRWREVPRNPEGNKKRVAFVGDSFTFGLWADSVEQSFVGVFESEAPVARFEALNFGVPGYGFEDMELLIREQVLQFQPSCILLASYNGNDFLDTYLGLERYQVTHTGRLELNRQRLKTKIPAEYRRGSFKFRRALAETFYLLRLAKTALQVTGFSRALATEQRPGEDRSYSSDLFWSQREYPDFAEAAKQVSLATLRRIAALCQQHGFEFRIATIPSNDQLKFPEALAGEYRRDLPQAHVGALAAEASVPFLDLLPGLEAYERESGKEVYHPAGHLTNDGHRAVAHLLHEFFGNTAL